MAFGFIRDAAKGVAGLAGDAVGGVLGGAGNIIQGTRGALTGGPVQIPDVDANRPPIQVPNADQLRGGFGARPSVTQGPGSFTQRPSITSGTAAPFIQSPVGREQAEFRSDLREQAAGTGGPTAAQALQRRALDEAARAQMAQATAQPGVSAGAALRAGQIAGGDVARRGIADAAALRAQEQLSAQQLLGDQLGQARGQDIQTAQANAQNALQQRALELQELGLNQQDNLNRMALELKETLAQQGFNMDAEKLRLATELALRNGDIQLAVKQAGMNAQEQGAFLQVLSSLGGAAIGAA